MRRNKVVSLFDLTGNAVLPWALAGYECYIIDLQHEPWVENFPGGGSITRVKYDLSNYWLPPFPVSEIAAAFSASPCTDMSTSGARWFKGKGLISLADSIHLFAIGVTWCEWTGAPFMAEHPRSTISTYFRPADYTFHPFEYAGLHPEDNYTKTTCAWTGNGFVMPDPVPLVGAGKPDNRIHMAGPGPERANFRSAAPTGFFKAVFEANCLQSMKKGD